ncbi:hypothetical protein EV356DRAFT_475695 [Viridothelium virens]|uniref:Carboxymuconolactone decarboxylase-like domain-containing protein n=1 Tax=Viridothelium virens TaxID=1048519 RepID=A0A6A6GUG4_VIRVR|nr:hypothetical protein EV356DRAFT_475695 [Viridothelium virens]
MARFPVITSDESMPSRQLIEKGADTLLSRAPYLEYKDAEGNYLGPFASLIYTPDIIEAYFQCAFAVGKQERFTPRERELCVLAVLAVYDAPYPLYIHSEVAVKCGISASEVQQAVNGKTPDGLEKVEAIIYNFSLNLAQSRSPLDAATFEEARNVLGRERVAGLAQLVCAYVQVSILSNIDGGKIPARKEGVFFASKDTKSK